MLATSSAPADVAAADPKTVQQPLEKHHKLCGEERRRSYTKSLYRGFCEENTRDKKKAGNKTQAPTPKEQRLHLQGSFKDASTWDCNLKQDARTKQKKKTRHEIDLREFSYEAAWKVLRRKENESKLKWERTNSNKTQSAIKRRSSFTKGSLK